MKGGIVALMGAHCCTNGMAQTTSQEVLLPIAQWSSTSCPRESPWQQERRPSPSTTNYLQNPERKQYKEVL